MCTAVSFKSKDHYFGRNLDLEYSYHETVTVTRSYPFAFRHETEQKRHFAMIGMAYVADGCPLYYDAVNEKGVGMAGLNFPGNAVYRAEEAGKHNIASFELIPWVLGQCSTVDEAEKLLAETNVTSEAFNEGLPPTPLHWIVSDRERTIVAEPLKDGLKLYDDPVKVMTNNPTFDWHMTNLSNYMALSKEAPVNSFSGEVELKPYSRGMGAMGLPGDLSSASRFVKAAFTRMNSLCGESESESLSQFFQILGSVAQQRGLVHMGHGQYEITIYSSCCNTDRGIYYYTTYENSQITGVDMHHTDLDSSELSSWPLVTGQQIRMEN